MDMENTRSSNVLKLTVNGEPWQRVDDLSLAKPDDPVYCGIEQNDGSVTIRFGDGINGKRPKNGDEVNVEYKTLAGPSGNAD